MKKALVIIGIILIGFVIAGIIIFNQKNQQANTAVYYYMPAWSEDYANELQIPASAIKDKPPIYVHNVMFGFSLVTQEGGKYNNIHYTFTNTSDKNIEDFHITYKLPDGKDFTVGGVSRYLKVLPPGESSGGLVPLKKEYTAEMLTLEKLTIVLDDNGKKITLDYDYPTQIYKWTEKN